MGKLLAILAANPLLADEYPWIPCTLRAFADSFIPPSSGSCAAKPKQAHCADGCVRAVK
jgi:hypothetical protein